jgi:inorganic pyrophosphatase
MEDGEFWSKLDQLVSTHKLVIDRPRDSAHPRFATHLYPLDYGHLHGTGAGDGDGIDVWVGSLGHQGITGVICTVDLCQGDAELKILRGCTPAEAQMALRMHNIGGQSAILIERQPITSSAGQHDPTREG